MATKAEVANMISTAVVSLLAGNVDETLPELQHVEFGEQVYKPGSHVFEVKADGETFRVIVSKPRDYHV